MQVLYDLVRTPEWVSYNTVESIENVKKILAEIKPDQEAVLMSVHGGVSSPDIVRAIGELTPIKILDVSSLSVGVPAIRQMDIMHSDGLLDTANFYLSSVMKNSQTNKSQGYLEVFDTIVEDNGWYSTIINNHSKIVLCDCGSDKTYVLESSANFNKNPKMENFRISTSERLYGFYKDIFDSIKTKKPTSCKVLECYDESEKTGAFGI